MAGARQAGARRVRELRQPLQAETPDSSRGRRGFPARFSSVQGQQRDLDPRCRARSSLRLRGGGGGRHAPTARPQHPPWLRQDGTTGCSAPRGAAAPASHKANLKESRAREENEDRVAKILLVSGVPREPVTPLSLVAAVGPSTGFPRGCFVFRGFHPPTASCRGPGGPKRPRSACR